MIRAFIAGLGRLIDVWPRVPVGGYRQANELEALRSDTQRIGDDMRAVIGQQSPARPVQGPVDMAELRRKVMARHPTVRKTLAEK